MDGYMMMPLAVFSLGWALAFKQVIRGAVYGEMIEYVRRNNTSRRCSQESEPMPFTVLFVFYSAVTFAVPIALLAMLRAS